MAEALRFIHFHAGQPIRTEHVVQRVQLSRRALEIRFHKSLGHTIHDAIQQARLERATRLLLETNLPIAKVAEAAGYSTPSYLIQVFRQQRGTTPTRYRARVLGKAFDRTRHE